jgi:hypothetical protein
MSTEIGEDIRGVAKTLVQSLQKLPTPQYEKSELDVTEQELFSPEQKLLLGALGLVLEFWPDRETAESIGIDFGLMEVFRNLGPKDSLIFTVGCPSEFQLEVKRLPELREAPNPFACRVCCCDSHGKPYCCLTISRG